MQKRSLNASKPEVWRLLHYLQSLWRALARRIAEFHGLLEVLAAAFRPQRAFELDLKDELSLIFI